MVAISKRGFIVAALLSAFFAFVFAVFGCIRSGFSVVTFLSYGLAGAILGLIGAPEVEPKAFRYPTLWQILFAVSGSLLLAASLDAPPEGYAVAVVVGVALGYLAPYWIKHIQGP
jgi:hypothetical protein